MVSYYYAMAFITVATMVTSIVHLFENQTLSRRVRNKLTFISALVITGVMCEFVCTCLNGNNICSNYIQGSIKAIEFSVAPIIPIEYMKIIGYRDLSLKVKLATNALLMFNIICEIISIFNPFIFYIDENNKYNHGKYYEIYIIMYFTGIAMFILEMLKYTKKYQSRNIATLLSILIFLLIGFSIRIIDSSIHSDWLVVAITYLLFIIYYSDLSLKVDVLTDLLNRKSYEHRLKKLDYATVIIVLDVNKFKQVNDKYGHQIGDKVLRVIAKTIIKVYGKYAYCYRIGGDEFCVILKPGIWEKFVESNNGLDTSKFIEELNQKFDKAISMQNKEYPMLEYGVSKGYAIFSGLYDVKSQDEEKNHYTLVSVKETVKLADERMYIEKRKLEQTSK